MEQLKIKNRKALRNKMAEVFSEDIKALPVEVQYILLDDLVTAFEKRLSMFSSAQSRVLLAECELAINTEQAIA